MTGNKARILAVDDDVDFLDWVRIVLEAAGHEVVCFSDAENALASITDAPPDLIITDLMMESLDAGFSFARRTKEAGNLCHVPIIIVTAAESRRGFDFRPRTGEDLAAMHVDAFFCKPVDVKALRMKVQELLNRERRATNTGNAT
jgi:DNA-binding response OmpR family regulator